MPFDNLSTAEARTLVSAPEWFTAAAAFVGIRGEEPDHWQSGAGYTGPVPATGDSRAVGYLDALEPVFVTEDLITEALGRRRTGVLGKTPRVEVRSRAEDARADAEGATGEGDAGTDPDESSGDEPTEAEAWTESIAAWMEAAEVQTEIERFVDGLGFAGKSYLRLLIPHGRLTEEGQVQADDAMDALQHVFVEACYRDEAVVYTDPDTRYRCAIVIGLGTPEADEARRAADTSDPTAAELSYLDPKTGRTAIRITQSTKGSANGSGADDGNTAVAPDTVQWDLGGRLLLHEGDARPLLSPGVRANQRALNTTRTMIRLANDKAGFPETYFRDIAAPEDENGNAQPIETGPGSSGFVYSYRDNSNGEVQTPGEIVRLDPADTTGLHADCDVSRMAILRGMHQAHMATSISAAASGEARVQDRHDYVADLNTLADHAEKALRWAVEGAVALAHAAVGEPLPSDLYAAVQVRVDPGPLTPEMRRAIIEAHERRVISRARAMQMLGVEDPDAEAALIEEEQADSRDALETERTRLELEQTRRDSDPLSDARGAIEAARAAQQTT